MSGLAATLRANGTSLVDPFGSLFKLGDEEIRRLAAAESRRCDRRLVRLCRLQDQLLGDAEALASHDQSPALRSEAYGEWEYYSTADDRRMYRRPRGAPTSEAGQLVLDQGKLGLGDIRGLSFSRDGRVMAFAADSLGDEQFTIYAYSVDRAGMITQIRQISRCSSEFVLSPDGGTIYYLPLSETLQSNVVRLCALFRSDRVDSIVATEADSRRWLIPGLTQSESYLQVASISRTGSRMVLYSLPADESSAVVLPPIPGCEPCHIVIEHLPTESANYFLAHVVSMDSSEVLIAFSSEKSSSRSWRRILKQAPGYSIRGLRSFKCGLFLSCADNSGNTSCEFLSLATVLKHAQCETLEPAYVPGPETTALVAPSKTGTLVHDGTSDWDATKIRFIVRQIDLPPSAYEFDPLDGVGLTPISDQVATGSRLQSEKIWCNSRDGGHVPITVLRDDGVSGPAPTVLSVYGAYGLSSDLPYSPMMHALVKRGIVFAVAHVRGGGELGPEWYAQGRGLRKRTSSEDLVACAEHLVSRGISSPGALALECHSAGAVTGGLAVSLEPTLFTVVLMINPFVDPLGTFLANPTDTTQADREEWGDPWKSTFELLQMRDLSPYWTIPPNACNYPDFLIMTGLNDSRAPLASSLRYVLRLRRSGAAADLYVDRSIGHMGPSSVKAGFNRMAMGYSWLLRALLGNQPC